MNSEDLVLVGLAHHRGHNHPAVFVSTDGMAPLDVYASYDGVQSPCKWVKRGDVHEIAERYAGDVFGTSLPDLNFYVLETSADGWGLYCYDDTHEDWNLIDFHDRIQRQEIDMADQAHINDLRFGAASDDSDWYSPGDFGYDDTPYDEEDLS